MYSNTQLKTIFEQPYDRTIWLNVLRDNLGLQTIYKSPKGIAIKNADSKSKLADEYIPLGELTTSEGRLIGIYEVPVSATIRLQYNKVGLRTLLKNIYEQEVDAAFVAFYQKSKWRFSYISEISTMQDGKRATKATDPKRFTYLMGQGERCKTAADRFAGIRSVKDLVATGITLKALEEAFNVEKMSRAFFDEYRKHYGKFTSYLTGKDENSKETGKPPVSFHQTFKGEHKEKHARDFIKKLMGRIVFLYFLQKKGWLGVPENEVYGKGNENFVSDLFNNCKYQGEFYSEVLVPLFFETLNCKRTGDLFEIEATQFVNPAYNKVKIPYLNGGLFDNSEKDTDRLIFPKELFAALFAFFDQYNFTVYEDSPDEHTVAVDPEMLGHIFENLLEDNKDKGAFYTPKEIVHYMCQESLIEYLYTQLNPQQTETHLELGKKQTDMFGNTGKKGQLALTQPVATNKEQVSRELLEALVKRSDVSNLTDWDEAILKALRDVKICDPAIGSGAFPMGLLMEIFHLVETLHGFSPDVTQDVWKLDGEWNAAKVKEQIIQNSIYGVDIEKGAVDIARLRFWLSLVVDEETPKPLPNLDYKIVVGNSLLSKFEDEVIDIEWIDGVSIDTADRKRMKLQEALDELADKQRKFFDAKGNKQKLQKDIRNLKIDILKGELQLARDKFVKTTAFTGSMYGLTEKEKVKVAENKIRIGSFDIAIEKLNGIQKDEKQPLEFFDWKLDFSEVMNKKVNKKEEGFDIVIGNPPYIQLQKLNKYADELQKRNFKTFARTGDIYCLFYEVGFSILKQNSLLTYITSNKWMRAAYGEAIRKFFVTDINPLLLIDFAGFKVFDSATVDTNILIAKTTAFQNKVNTCVLGKGFSLNNMSDYFRQHTTVTNSFSAENSWVVLSSIEQGIKAKIENAGTPLKDWDINIYRGVLTGYNEAFIIDTPTKDKLITASPKSAEIIRPILKGKHIKKYGLLNQKEWIIIIPCGWTNKNRDGKNAEVFFKAHYNSVYNHLIEKSLVTSKGKGLFERDDQGDYWWELRPCAYLNEFEKAKILYIDIMTDNEKEGYPFPCFSYAQNGVFTLNTAYFMVGENDDLKYILGLLNSKLGKFIVKSNVTPLQKRQYRMFQQFVERFIIPIPTLDNKKVIINLVDEIIRRMTQDLDTASYELKVNNTVHEICGFTAAEIALIENQE